MMRIDALLPASLILSGRAACISGTANRPLPHAKRMLVGTVEQHGWSSCSASRIATKALPTWRD
jgi:hypothetical protein